MVGPSQSKTLLRLSNAGLIVLVLCLAFGLRLAYAHKVSPFVDEYISMLAIHAIAEHGIPVLPSGLFYGPKGLLHNYVGSLALSLFGPSEFGFRYLSVLVGVLTVCCLYRAGRDWFSPPVGVSAAAALAWLPSAVKWGARARMYSMLQLFSLVGIYLLVNGYLRENDRRARVLGALVMLLATLSHPLALVALGSAIIGVAAARLTSFRGIRQLWPPSMGESLAWALLVIAVIALNPTKGAWGFRLESAEIAQGALGRWHPMDRLAYLLAFSYQFVVWPLWPVTLLYVIGLINLALRRTNKAPIPGDGVAWGLYALGLCAWVTTSFLPTLHADRYMFAIVPIYILLATRELCALIVAVGKSFQRAARAPIVSVIASVLVIALLATCTLRLVSEDPLSLAPAYEYVLARWQPGDVVGTAAPAASLLLLGRTDYYVIQHGIEAQDDADIWTGAPLIDTPEKFRAMLADHPRVWLVLERLAWERHLGDGLREIVQDDMRLAFDRKGMLVFVSP